MKCTLCNKEAVHHNLCHDHIKEVVEYWNNYIVHDEKVWLRYDMTVDEGFNEEFGDVLETFPEEESEYYDVSNDTEVGYSVDDVVKHIIEQIRK